MRQVFGNCSDVAKQMLVGYGIPGIAQISRYSPDIQVFQV